MAEYKQLTEDNAQLIDENARLQSTSLLDQDSSPDLSSLSAEDLILLVDKIIPYLEQFGYRVVASESTSLQQKSSVGEEINIEGWSKKDVVRVRETPSLKGRQLLNLKYHQRFLVIREEINDEGEYWSYVKVSEKCSGYVKSEFIELIGEPAEAVE